MEFNNSKVKDNLEPLLNEGGDEDEASSLEEGINKSDFLSEFNEHCFRYSRSHKDERAFYVHGKYRYFSEKSLYVFDNHSWLRY